MPYIGNVLTSFAVETGNINDQAITSPKLSATGGTDGQVLALDSNGDLVWSSDPAGQWVTNGNDIYFDRASNNTNVATAGGIFVANTNTDANNVVALSFTAEPTDVAHPAAKIGAVFADRTTDSEDTHLYFSVVGAGTASEAARIDSSGRLLVGTNASNGANATIQSIGTHPLQIHRGVDGTGGPNLTLSKSRNTAYGANTIVQDDDTLGTIQFRGDDGTDYGSQAAYIQAFVDGTPDANEMPGRLVFSTNDGTTSAAPTERMVINNSGNVGIGNFTDPNARLEIRGDRNAVIRLTNERTTESAGQTLGRLEFFGSDTSGPGAGVRSSITARTAESDGTGSTLAFSTGTATENNQEAMRINQDQNLLIGLTSRIDANARLQIADDEFPADIILARNDTSVASNSIGRIWFYGNDSDGTFEQVAQIGVDAEGSHTSDSKPGMMRFFTTASGSTTTTERLRITANGTLELRNSPGISFAQIQGAPDAGTSTSEVLGEYEEGEWTPVLVGSTTDGSYGYDTARTGGVYVRVGRLVHLQGSMRVTSTTTAATGSAFIGGVPFTPLAQSAAYNRTAAGILRVQPSSGSITMSDGAAFAFLEGSERLGMGVQTTTGWSNISVTDADDHQLIWFFSVSYETSDT